MTEQGIYQQSDIFLLVIIMQGERFVCLFIYRKSLYNKRCESKSTHIFSHNNHQLIDARYAVRGKIVLRASEIEKEMAAGKKFPFDSLVYCNIGNPQVTIFTKD